MVQACNSTGIPSLRPAASPLQTFLRHTRDDCTHGNLLLREALINPVRQCWGQLSCGKFGLKTAISADFPVSFSLTESTEIGSKSLLLIAFNS